MPPPPPLRPPRSFPAAPFPHPRPSLSGPAFPPLLSSRFSPNREASIVVSLSFRTDDDAFVVSPLSSGARFHVSFRSFHPRRRTGLTELLFLFFLRFRLCPGRFLYPVITSTIAFIDLPITVLSPGCNGVAAGGLSAGSFPVGLARFQTDRGRGKREKSRERSLPLSHLRGNYSNRETEERSRREKEREREGEAYARDRQCARLFLSGRVISDRWRNL